MIALNLESALAPIFTQVWFYFAWGTLTLGVGLGCYLVARGIWGMVRR